MKSVTRFSILATLAAAAAGAHATEYANVVSATAVTTQVAVPQRVCNDEQQYVRPRPSGAGALIGAITGGLIGHGVSGGAGFGRAAATGLGVVLGSAIGNRVESDGYPPREVTVQHCGVVSAYQTRTIGYDVVYDYAGRRYTTRMPNDPGARIAVDVRPVIGSAPAPAYDDGYAAPPAAYGTGRIGTPVPSTIAYASPGWRGRGD